MRWPIGIFVAGVIVVGVNMAFIWIATHNDDPLVDSYSTEAR